MALQVFISHTTADAEIARAVQGWIQETFLDAVKVFVSSDGASAGG